MRALMMETQSVHELLSKVEGYPLARSEAAGVMEGCNL